MASDTPYAFSQRDAERIAQVVRDWERQPRNNPYQATRWPVGGESGSIRYGTLAAAITASSGVPVDVNELIYNGTSQSWTSNNSQFKAVNFHNVDLDQGVRVSCGPTNDAAVWSILQADCTAQGSTVIDLCVGVECPPDYYCDPATGDCIPVVGGGGGGGGALPPPP